MDDKVNLSLLQILQRNIKANDEIRANLLALSQHMVSSVLRRGWHYNEPDPVYSVDIRAEWSPIHRTPEIVIRIDPRGHKPSNPNQRLIVTYDPQTPQSLWFCGQEYELTTDEVKAKLGESLINKLTEPTYWVAVVQDDDFLPF